MDAASGFEPSPYAIIAMYLQMKGITLSLGNLPLVGVKEVISEQSPAVLAFLSSLRSVCHILSGGEKSASLCLTVSDQNKMLVNKPC